MQKINEKGQEIFKRDILRLKQTWKTLFEKKYEEKENLLTQREKRKNQEPDTKDATGNNTSVPPPIINNLRANLKRK